QRLKTQPRQTRQVGQPLAAAVRLEKWAGLGVMRLECRLHFRADFERLRPDARTQPSNRVFSACAVTALQPLPQAFDDAPARLPCQPAPSAMRGGDGTAI